MVSMISFEIIPPPESSTDSHESLSPEMVASSTPDGDNGACACSENVTSRSVESFLSSLFDSRAEEMQKRVDELLQENNFLKEKVKKSNIVMLEQLNTISSWGKEIKEYKKKQNDLLEEKQKSIENLQQKVNELQDKMEQLQNSENLMPIKLEENQMQAKVIDEKEISIKELQKQNEDLADIVRNLSEDLDKFQNKNKELETEAKELRDFNNCLLTEISEPKTSTNVKEFSTSVFNDDESGYAIVFKEEQKPVKASVDLQTKSICEELSELRAKYLKLQADLDDEKIRSQNLEEQLLEKNKQIGVLTDKNRCKKKKRDSSGNSATTKDCEDLAYALWAKSDLVDIYKKTSEELEQELLETKRTLDVVRAESLAVVAELKAESSCLKESLKQEEYTNELQRKSLAEAEKNLKHLSDMHERAMKLLNAQEESEMMKSEQLHTLKDISERHHLEQLDIATAKLFNMEQLLEAEQEKTEKLQKELDSIKQDSQEISVLKTQIEIYKADFQKEKFSVEISRAEIERLKKERNELEKKLEELMDTHSHSRKSHKHSKHHPKDRRSHKGRNSVGANAPDNGSEEDEEDSNKMEKLSCPHCKMLFHNVEYLQSHIELCRNDDIFCV